MDQYPLRQEFSVSAEINLPLCEDSEYVYLFHGSKWKILETEVCNQLTNIFESELINFIYLPKILGQLNPSVFSYNFPGLSLDNTVDFALQQQRILDLLSFKLQENEYLFIRYCSNDEEYKCYVFPADNFTSLIYEVKGYLSVILPEDNLDCACLIELEEHKCRSVRFLASYKISDCFSFTKNADETFTSEQCALIDKAIDAVKQLQLSGVPLAVIKKLIEPEVRLSRVVITKRFKILLPDYDKEIKMGPLPKTIFLFFLKHDRKFMFSDLMDYKEEILRIYEKVSNRDDRNKMRESIERLVDPMDNSICEKCTAVRTAFMEQITYDIARNYFIEGRQGEPKQIHLDRTLVEWEEQL